MPPAPETALRAAEPLPPAAPTAPPAGPREAPPPAPRPDEALFRKLTWLTLFRLVEVTVLLGATALVQWRAAGPDGGGLYTLICGTYVISLGFALLLRQRRGLPAIAFAQVAVDVGIAAAVVSITGYGESVFVFMYLLAIVNGSILLYRTGALWGAGLSLATYLPLFVLGPSRRGPLLVLFVHAGAFVLTAALASYLSEQLRRTGQRLEEREGDLAAITALHESIVQSLGSGLLTMDARGNVTFLNLAGEQIMGVRLQQVIGQPAHRSFPSFEPSSGRDETEYVNAAGERRCLGYTRFPLVARAGRPIGTAVIFQDLTALREMERQVQRSQRLADLGRVAAGLAHELRNPLASMAGSIELLKGAPGLREQDARLMDIVLREAGRLEQLVAAFLAFSRPAPPRRDRVELDRVLGEALDVFAHDPAAARVRLERVLRPTAAWCDADQVRQVFWNLAVNACHAAGGGERGHVRVACGPDGDRATFTVEDDGSGIAPADLKQLFTPFFTTKERGTGLGLATVQRIVDAHGGTVSVDSVPGRGTRFTVRLPAAAPAQAG